MKREYTGIHLGKDFISAARVESNKIVAFTRLNLSPLKEGTNREIVQEDVLWEALINKGLREIGTEHGNVFVSLEDREFIFRGFDIPLISRKEIESSISYEIEKYIPFKIEELVWDYNYTRAYKYRKINFSFVGIKTASYKKYKSFFANTDVNVLNIEPVAISLARAVKSLRYARKMKNFAILDFSEGVSYITFFYNDLPVFNRSLGIFQKDKDETVTIDKIDKLADEIRASTQYFKREFKEYTLNKLFALCDASRAELLTSLKGKIDIELEVITAGDILHTEGVSLEHLKAYAAAAVSLLPLRFSPEFRSKDEASISKNKMPTNIPIPFVNNTLLGIVIFIGVIACFFEYSILNNKLTEKDYKINQRIKKITLPDVARGKSIEDAKQFIKKRVYNINRRIDKLKPELREYSPVYPVLRHFPDALSKGMWLSGFSMIRNKKNKLELKISGYVLSVDNRRGRAAIDEFVSSFKSNNTLNHYFRKIDLNSMDKAKVNGYNVIKFSLNIE